MKLATADFSFPLLAHDKVLDLIALLELDGVDIGLFEGRSHLWPSREFKNASASGKRLGRKLADRGLQAADVFLQMNPDFMPFAINNPEAARRQKARNWFLKTLDYANACGARHVTTLPGVHFNDDSWPRTCDELAWRVAQARATPADVRRRGAHRITRTDAARRRTISEERPGLTLTLDYTHFTRIGLPDSAIEPLVKYATHFHTRGARKGRLQTSFKQNVIDYARVLKVMQQTGYRGWIGIEYVWIDWEHANECDNISETIQYRDFFRRRMK